MTQTTPAPLLGLHPTFSNKMDAREMAWHLHGLVTNWIGPLYVTVFSCCGFNLTPVFSFTVKI